MVSRAGLGFLPLFLSPALSLLLCQELNQGPFFILVRLPTTAHINAFCDRRCCYCCAGPLGRDANPYKVSYSVVISRIMMLLRQDITLPCCTLLTRTTAKSDLRNYIERVFFFCQYFSISRKWGSNFLWFVWKETLARKSHLSIVSGALSPRPQSTQWL